MGSSFKIEIQFIYTSLVNHKSLKSNLIAFLIFCRKKKILKHHHMIGMNYEAIFKVQNSNV